jgi:hypothetical protein
MEEMVSISRSEYERMKQQSSEYERMKQQIASLQEELSLLKSGRSSRSTPPSHDIGRSNGNSLRSKSGKKSGGQCGHQGHTLPKSDHPDEI